LKQIVLTKPKSKCKTQ